MLLLPVQRPTGFACLQVLLVIFLAGFSGAQVPAGTCWNGVGSLFMFNTTYAGVVHSHGLCVYQPAGWQGNRPLLLNFHGCGGNYNTFFFNAATANTYGWIFAAFQSEANCWYWDWSNSDGDYYFDAVDFIFNNYPIDKSQVFATGFSSGGAWLKIFLSCYDQGRYLAIAGASGSDVQQVSACSRWPSNVRFNYLSTYGSNEVGKITVDSSSLHQTPFILPFLCLTKLLEAEAITWNQNFAQVQGCSNANNPAITNVTHIHAGTTDYTQLYNYGTCSYGITDSYIVYPMGHAIPSNSTWDVDFYGLSIKMWTSLGDKVSSCSAAGTCGVGGRCLDTGGCICSTGYVGSNCQYWSASTALSGYGYKACLHRRPTTSAGYLVGVQYKLQFSGALPPNVTLLIFNSSDRISFTLSNYLTVAISGTSGQTKTVNFASPVPVGPGVFVGVSSWTSTNLPFAMDTSNGFGSYFSSSSVPRTVGSSVNSFFDWPPPGGSVAWTPFFTKTLVAPASPPQGSAQPAASPLASPKAAPPGQSPPAPIAAPLSAGTVPTSVPKAAPTGQAPSTPLSVPNAAVQPPSAAPTSAGASPSSTVPSPAYPGQTPVVSANAPNSGTQSPFTTGGAPVPSPPTSQTPDSASRVASNSSKLGPLCVFFGSCVLFVWLF